MAISVSDFAAERRPIRIEAPGGLFLKVVYAPHALTANDVVRVAEAKGLDSYRELLALLEKIILEWDLIGPLHDQDGNEVVAEGATVPTRKEVMQHVPQTVLALVYTRIQEDSRPKPRTSSTPSGPLFEVTG